MVTFAIILKIDGRYVELFYSRLLGYLNGITDGYDFDECFLWSKNAYTGNTPQKHQMYNLIRETGYTNITGKWHEVQWKEIRVEHKGHYIILSNNMNSHIVAIPPSSTLRYDYILADGRYRYGCAKDEFEGIEITVGNKLNK